jgi:hypothetical protein
MENRVLPGTKPSVTALSHEAVPFALANDHGNAVVTHVQRLPRPLHPVTEHGNGFVFKQFSRLLQGKLLCGDHFFNRSAKIDLRHFMLLYYSNSSDSLLNFSIWLV